MIISKLELTSWRKIRTLALEFREGINLLYGPNEIGKSTIMEAIKQALIGDAASRRQEYKDLQPWGTDVTAKVNLFFTTRDGKDYRVYKSFPGGKGDLYLSGVHLTEDPHKTQRKLYEILYIPEKTTGLFNLLFIDQGEALNIFDKDRKKNPMAEETRSHIRNVIKETAFRTLQAFQDSLKPGRDILFTNPDMKKFKSGRNAPPYMRLLEDAREEREQLKELREQIEEFSQRLEEMEKREKEIKQLSADKGKKEELLSHMADKEVELEKLEKKELEFKPLKQDYEQFIKIVGQLEELQRALPRQYARARQLTLDLTEKIEKQQATQKEKQQYKAALKAKKEKSEQLKEYERKFKDLEQAYTGLLEINKNLSGINRELPILFALNRTELDKDVAGIEKKITGYEKTEAGLKNLDKQLDDYPQMTQKKIEDIKKIAHAIDKLETQLKAARSALKMQFEVAPAGNREIAFDLKIDEEGTVSRKTSQPLAVEDFRQLSFLYPGHFDIHISGRPVDIDVDSIHEKLRHKKEELKQHLTDMKVANTAELEKKFLEYCQLTGEKEKTQNRLDSLTPLEELNRQKARIEANRASLQQDLKKYTGMEALPGDLPADEPLRLLSGPELRDKLTENKTKRDNLTERTAGILKNRTFAALEKEYRENEKGYRKLQAALKEMEPKDLPEAHQGRIDKIEYELKKIEQEITAKENDKQLLGNMEWRAEFRCDNVTPESSPGQTAQQIRDDIKEMLTRLDDLTKRKEDILKKRKQDGLDESLETEYLRKKEEIDLLVKRSAAMVPIEVNTIEKIKNKIAEVKEDLERKAADIKAKEINMAELKTKLGGYGAAAGEKNRVESRHRHTLEEIKRELTDVYALKLLLMLIEEEKEKAQQEIFKPLEDRIIRGVERLIPGGKYKLGIDNNLDMKISARDVGGDFRDVSREDLSFGTKEQLSFLLRLSIAEQLSQKEPQVMILDDSFVNTDHYRLPQLLELIEQSSRTIQFLIFTCKQEDYLRCKGRFHTINLEELL